MTPIGTWVLAVDFGTTNTVAAVGDANAIRTLTIDGKSVRPSAVLLNDGGRRHEDTWIVGEAAINLAQGRREWFEACPKRWVADRTLFLGGKNVPVAEAIAALFGPIVAEAAQQHGGRPPTAFVVTHPATWVGARIRLLVDGARAATRGLDGWPEPLTLPEPVAAAQRVLDLEAVPEHVRIVVLDLGGGTVDVSVVDRDGDHLTVVGRPTGNDGFGGEDFDLRLADWMTAEAGAPGLFAKLAGSADPEERERANDIRGHARAVKEQLSRQPAVPAQLPKSPPELPAVKRLQVSQSVLEDLVRGGPGRKQGLTEAVDLVADALSTAPPGPLFGGVFLVGGGSRIPLLGTLVGKRTARAPIMHGDPTTAVADGAARYAWTKIPAARPAAAPKPRVRTTTRGPDVRPAAPPPPPARRRKKGRAFAGVAAFVVLVGGTVALAAKLGDGGSGQATSSTTYTCSNGREVGYSYQCASASTSTSATKTTGSGAAGRLTSHVPAELATGCQTVSAPDDLATGLVAAVKCTPKGGPDAIEFYQYSSATAMNSAFSTWVDDAPVTGSCDSSRQHQGTYSVDDTPMGRFVCYTSSEGDSVFGWTNVELNILSFCSDGQVGPGRLQAWFQESAKLE